jgi:hypothetical protein
MKLGFVGTGLMARDHMRNLRLMTAAQFVALDTPFLHPLSGRSGLRVREVPASMLWSLRHPIILMRGFSRPCSQPIFTFLAKSRWQALMKTIDISVTK